MTFRILLHVLKCPRRLIPHVFLTGFFVMVLPLYGEEAPEVFFEKRVFPILQQHCFECHGPDVQHGGLRLDAKQTALQGGKHGAAIHPGDPQNSLLIQRILTDNSQQRMPLGKPPLPPEETRILHTWIERGAVWKEGVGEEISELKPHWSFVAPQKTDPPTASAAWGKNPIDAFIYAKLQENRLLPNPPEDRKKLIRRMYLDVIGLPPGLDELERYANDSAPDWDERLMDDLLASPHYGEKWGRHWLDAARYADTNGYEKDRHRDIWAYRDYVIQSLNQDKPFDQFTIEQIAGDLLPDTGLEPLIATGFHRNTLHNEEGGVEVEEFRFESIVDRVNTVSTVFLGLTVACAQCHTHKYDPITHKEYYAFFAYFNNCDEVAVPIPDETVEQKRREIKQSIQEYLAGLANRFPATDLQTVWKTAAPMNPATQEGLLLHTENDWIHTQSTRLETITYFIILQPEQESIDRIRFRFQDGQKRDFSPALRIIDPQSTGTDSITLQAQTQPSSRESEIHYVFKEAVTLSSNRHLLLEIETNGALSPFQIDLGLRARKPVRSNADIRAIREERLQRHFQQWLQDKQEQAAQWRPLLPTYTETQNHTLLKSVQGLSLLAYGDMPNNDVYTITYRAPVFSIRSLQLSALRDPGLPGQGPGRGTVLQDGNFMLSEITAEVISDGKTVRTLKFDSAAATSHAKNATAGNAVDGDRNTGWSIQKNPLRLYQAVFNFAEPVHIQPHEQLRITLDQNYIHTYTLGRFRISASGESIPFPSGLPEALESALVSGDEISSRQRALLHYYFLLETPELAEEQKTLAALLDSIPPHTTSLIVRQRDLPRTTHLHHRGEYLQPRDPVQPGVFSILHPLTEPQTDMPARLQFAKWLVDSKNPLTARVTVNRIWMRYFGRGIVETVDDFGTRGSLPSHPELLDWLAVEFMENGWSLKHIHRLILSSAVYRQSADIHPEALEKDPDNEWYSRGPRFRIDAELIRDNALSISGLLNPVIGGPSVFPPIPDGMGALSYGGLRWNTETGKNRYRRGLYTYWKRTNPYPMFTTFDAPPGDTACVMRNRSNTPLQSLTLLNDTFFFEASQALAFRILTEQRGTLTEKLRIAFALCTARDPSEEESGALLRYYGKQYLRIIRGELLPVAQPIEAIDLTRVDPNQWQAWTLVSRVLLNLDETVTK